MNIAETEGLIIRLQGRGKLYLQPNSCRLLMHEVLRPLLAWLAARPYSIFVHLLLHFGNCLANYNYQFLKKCCQNYLRKNNTTKPTKATKKHEFSPLFILPSTA